MAECEIGGPIADEAVPRLCEGLDYQGKGITAEEGFLLSRIDGVSTVLSIVRATGLGEEKSRSLLQSLNDKGFLIFHLEGEAKPPETPPPGSSKDPSPDEMSDGASVVYDLPELKKVLRKKLPKDETIIPIVESIVAYLEELSYYDLLSVSRGADKAKVKKAYLIRTKSFHPDRFYRKADREFRNKLQEVFKQLNKGFKVLSDPEARASYDESLGSEEIGSQAEAEQPVVDTPEEEVTVKPKGFTVRRSRAVKGEGPRKVSADDVVLKPPKKKSGLADGTKLKLGLKGSKGASSPILKKIEKMRSADNPRIEQARKFYKGAMAEQVRGNFKGARVNLKLALQYDPVNKQYTEALANMDQLEESKQAELEFRAGREAHKDGDLGEAIKHYKEALSQGYDDPRLFHGLAELTMELDGNFERARVLMLKALEKNSNSVDFLMTLARAYKGLKKKEAAIAQLERVLKLEPKNKMAAKEIKALKRG